MVNNRNTNGFSRCLTRTDFEACLKELPDQISLLDFARAIGEDEIAETILEALGEDDEAKSENKEVQRLFSQSNTKEDDKHKISDELNGLSENVWNF